VCARPGLPPLSARAAVGPQKELIPGGGVLRIFGEMIGKPILKVVFDLSLNDVLDSLGLANSLVLEFVAAFPLLFNDSRGFRGVCVPWFYVAGSIAGGGATQRGCGLRPAFPRRFSF
jgi:hypothetical protein